MIRTIIGQRGRCGRAAVAGLGLDAADLPHRLVERLGHQLVHRLGLVPLDEVGPVAVALEERAELVALDAREQRGVGDLVAVEVQDREHGAVARGVHELVGVPARGERPGLGLAVPDDAARDQIGVVVDRAVGVHEGVAQLAALVDRTRGLGSHVAGDAAGEGELAEQPAKALFVVADVRVDLAVGALEVGVRHQPRATVPGAGYVDGVEVVHLDRAVHVRVDEVEPGRRPPMPEQPRLDVLEPKRLAQERVVEQVDLPHRQVVRRPPVPVQEPQLVGGERPLSAGLGLGLCHAASS